MYHPNRGTDMKIRVSTIVPIAISQIVDFPFTEEEAKILLEGECEPNTWEIWDRLYEFEAEITIQKRYEIENTDELAGLNMRDVSQYGEFYYEKLP